MKGLIILSAILLLLSLIPLVAKHLKQISLYEEIAKGLDQLIRQNTRGKCDYHEESFEGLYTMFSEALSIPFLLVLAIIIAGVLSALMNVV